MSRGTSFNEIVAAIEANERLTRAQVRSLLSYARIQEERADNHARRLSELRGTLEDAKTDLEIEKDHFIRLMKRWNGMIAMLHAFLGYKLYDDDTDPSERYRQALEEKFREK
jgi:hypothetical protein